VVRPRLTESEIRDKEELTKLKESYGFTGSQLASGGNKAVKELEKEQKTRSTRLQRDYIDNALLEISTFLWNVFLKKNRGVGHYHFEVEDEINHKFTEESIIMTINNVLRIRENLSSNASVNISIESLFLAQLNK
jgi:DNA polymerase-3 subunit delta'